VHGPADRAEGGAMLRSHGGGFDRSAMAAHHGAHRVLTKALPYRLPEPPHSRATPESAVIPRHAAARAGPTPW
jgi:hypothetical protein